MPRLIRILVYEGSRESLDDVMHRRGIKGSRSYAAGLSKVVIREAILGDFIEQFDTLPEPTGEQDA